MSKRIALFCPYLSSLGGGEKVALSIASILSNNNHVDIISETKIDLKKAFKYFGIDCNTNNIHLKEANYTNVTRHYLARFIPLPKLRFIYNHHYKFGLENNTNYDLFINNAYFSYLQPIAKESLYILMFPQEIISLPIGTPILSIVENWIIKKFFSDYNHIDKYINDYSYFLANSNFTAKMAKKRWGIKDNKLKILYPICGSFKKLKKEKLIISVGRIFPPDRYANNKNYEFMINAFKKISFIQPKWRYIIIGTCTDQDRQYLRKLIRMSRGYPIDIITNAKQPVLENYIGKSSLLWHACGYPQYYNNPENKEHFGMSVVEAMSAGCVPLAYNEGGLKESIDTSCGVLWNNETELIDNTNSLINQNNIRSNMSLSAQKKAKDYNYDVFIKKVNNIFKEYL